MLLPRSAAGGFFVLRANESPRLFRIGGLVPGSLRLQGLLPTSCKLASQQGPTTIGRWGQASSSVGVGLEPTTCGRVPAIVSSKSRSVAGHAIQTAPDFTNVGRRMPAAIGRQLAVNWPAFAWVTAHQYDM